MQQECFAQTDPHEALCFLLRTSCATGYFNIDSIPPRHCFVNQIFVYFSNTFPAIIHFIYSNLLILYDFCHIFYLYCTIPFPLSCFITIFPPGNMQTAQNLLLHFLSLCFSFFFPCQKDIIYPIHSCKPNITPILYLQQKLCFPLLHFYL